MSSRSLNKVTLIGNLTRDPELRYTPSGTAVCTFGVATNRSWLPEGATERKEETEFHKIVAWNKLAELCSQLLAKGRKVFVEGRLSTRSFTGQDGFQRTITEIVIDDMIILDSKRAFEEAGGSFSKSGNQPAATFPVSSTNQPFTQPQAGISISDQVNKPIVEEDKKEKLSEDEESKKKKKTTKTTKNEQSEKTGEEAVIEKPNELNTDDIPF